MKKHVVVIGGGMAGTAAAYTLTQKGYAVTIIEKGNRLGGRIYSATEAGTSFEMGAGFMTSSYTNMLDFVRQNGLEDKLYRQRGNSGIFRGNKVQLATASTLAGSKALSWKAKLQVVPLLAAILMHWRHLDIHAPWKAQALDTVAVADIFKGQGGKEFLEYVIQPILNGYFYWSPERTSRAILLMIGKALLKGGTYRLIGGLQQIPERAAAGSTIRLDHLVTSVQQIEHSFKVMVTSQKETSTILADGIVCATTASQVATILPSLTKQQKSFFNSVRYSSTALVSSIYRQEQAAINQGIAFPRDENKLLAAITVSQEPNHTKSPLSTVKLYASGLYGPQLIRESDNTLMNQLLTESSIVRSVVAPPHALALSSHIQRWPEALPLFDYGYFHKLKSFADGEIERPNQRIVFAGDYLGGPLMEGAFTSGLQAACRLDHYFSPHNTTQ